MNRSREKRQRAFSRGHHAETLAALYLMLKGYRIVERRYRTKLGEIDIIARRFSQILIVEVKARSEIETAMHAVSATSQRRIEAAADLWLARQKNWSKLSLRFDVIITQPWRWPKHYPAYFTARY